MVDSEAHRTRLRANVAPQGRQYHTEHRTGMKPIVEDLENLHGRRKTVGLEDGNNAFLRALRHVISAKQFN
jgi:hypothetical protein